jgi:uncharacterized protein (DUF433 family)
MPHIERIYIDHAVCHGKPCIEGTRIPAFVILDALAAGMTYEEIKTEYPPVNDEDIRACIHYAAVLAQEEEVTLKQGEESLELPYRCQSAALHKSGR